MTTHGRIEKPTPQILRGQVLSFVRDPFAEESPKDAAQLHEAVVVQGGSIAALGSFDALHAEFPNAAVHDHSGKLIMAGFVDAHVHYPQTAIIASWGKRLIDWLNSYTSPVKMRFGSSTCAEEIAGRYLDPNAARERKSVVQGKRGDAGGHRTGRKKSHTQYRNSIE